MTFNQDAQDGSQQEIVLDPSSLTAGKTYDLRIYFCNSSGQNRQVDLSFAGDGQAAVDTGFFNEDDATTSAGGYPDRNQVYYIDYRYTWDGDTTPGVTVTQSKGSIPFCLYALTNQEVAGGAAAPAAPVAAPAQPPPAAPPASATSTDLTAPAAPAGSGEGAAAVGENTAIATTQQVDTAAQSSDVGSESADFYNCDCLSQHGTWVTVNGYGTCWQPSGCGPGWRPYTCGHWGYSSDCGYTWISNASEEDWGWACYHYGRWASCGEQGWCWCPGRVWAPAWVSWRTGDDSCGCVGWAPLPPECGCTVGIGISTWVDAHYGIGPGCYSFCGINNMGAENLSTFIYSREQTVNIFNRTTNITNISYNQNSRTFYTGGPDYRHLNSLIARRGGKPIPSVVIDRRPNTLTVAGGKHSQLHGNVLTLAAPNVMPKKPITSKPTPAATIAATKVDHGWKQITDPKVAKTLRTKIAQEANGKTPKNTKAKLPAEVATATLTHPVSTPALHPGVTLKTTGAGTGTGLHPGVTLKTTGAGTGTGLHPGVTLNKTGPIPGTPQPSPKLMLHPGKSLKQAGTTVSTPGNPGQPSGTPRFIRVASRQVPPEVVKRPTPPAATPEGAPGQPSSTPPPQPGKSTKHHGKGVKQPTPPEATSEGAPGQPAGTPLPSPARPPNTTAKA